MGIDCGFDVYPALEPTPSNKQKYARFLKEVLTTYQTPIIERHGTHITFVVGEQPSIPHNCEHFLRFSSKISGSCGGAEKYVREVHKIAKERLGDCVHFWSELIDTDDARQWGCYDWNEVRAARRSMEEQDVDSRHDTEWIDCTSDAAMAKDRRLFTVQPIAGKGLGLVTTCKIFKGTRILSEAPIFRVPRDTNDLQMVQLVVTEGLKRLDRDHQRAFFSLHNAQRDEYGPFIGIAKTNTLPLGSGAREGGLFLEASRINHSCNPNSQNTWNTYLSQLTIHAFKDLQQGEEITINYLDGSPNHTTRQHRLRNSFGFDCACELCSLDLGQRRQSDRRLDTITELDSLIGDGLRIVNTPDTCLRDAYALLHLLEEERIVDARIPRLYYDAFQIAIANGDQTRAQVFANRAYAVRVVLEGKDSPEALRIRELAKRPIGHRLYGTSAKWRRALNQAPQGLSEPELEKWLWMKKD